MSAKRSAFRTTLIVVLTIVLMMGLTVNSAFAAEQETVVFVHTNDVHGHFEIEPYVKAVADTYKEQYGDENVITVSAGDVFAGGEPVAHMTAGESTVEVMNAAGYDAMAVGNNDAPIPTDGSDRLTQLLKHEQDTNFPIICANMVYSAAAGDLGEEGELPLNPYTVFTTASGVKIGMFGLTTTGSPPVGDDASFKKLDSIETAQKYVDILRNEEKVDIVVALGHTGWPDNDPTMTATTATDYNSYQISMAVDGIDLFIDGHTHSIIGENGVGYVCDNANKTLIVQTGCFGDNIGVVTMTIDSASKTISAKSEEQITRTDYEANYTPDAETLAVVQKWTDEINAKLGAVVGHTDYFLNGERTGSEDGMGIRLAEQNLGNLVTDAIRDSAGAEIAFFSGVRIRASLDAGDITVKGLHGVFANGGTVVKGEMTGAEIKAKLASSVASSAGGKESPDFAQVSGIRFVYDTDGNILSVKLESDGSELEDDKTYIVAGEMGGASVNNSITLYDGEDELVDMFTAYLASDMYDTSRYEGKLGRITRVEAAVYNDIAEGDEAYEAALYLKENGIMVGIGDKQFAPNLELSRAMAVTMLYRLAGEPEVDSQNPFTDVAEGAWYTDAVLWAAEKKIVDGYGDGRFGTNDSVTREQMAILLFRYAKAMGCDVSVGEDTNILSYDDAFDVSEWAVPAMQWSCGSGVMSGKTASTLNPKDELTRAEVAQIIMSFDTVVK